MTTARTAQFDPRRETFNPFVPGVMDDPYPYYRALRDLDPAHHNPDIGYWFLSRYEDVDGLGRDRRTLNRGDVGTSLFDPYRDTALWRLFGPMIFNMDDPEHGRLRGLIAQTFTRRRIEALRPRIEQICVDLLDRAGLDPAGGTFALIPTFAYPLPFLVICELLGLPTDGRDRLLGWTRAMVPILDPFPAKEVVDRAIEAADAFEQYLMAVLDERRAMLRSGRELPVGLLSDLVEGSESNREWFTDVDLVSMAFTVTAAGFENVTNLIGNSVRALTENPDQTRALRADRGLLANLPDEVLRYYSTTQYNARQAVVDIDLHGRRIPAGANIILLRGAANRDERRFPQPDTFDLRRPDSAHNLGFGEGPTFCVGAMLARMEVQIAFAALLDRIGEFRITHWEQQRTVLVWGPAAVEVEYGAPERIPG